MLKFYLKQQDEYVLIATTRPELLSSCQVVLVNPKDERFKKLWTMLGPIVTIATIITTAPIEEENTTTNQDITDIFENTYN